MRSMIEQNLAWGSIMTFSIFRYEVAPYDQASTWQLLPQAINRGLPHCKLETPTASLLQKFSQRIYSLLLQTPFSLAFHDADREATFIIKEL
jgi:hypothetical protein